MASTMFSVARHALFLLAAGLFTHISLAQPIPMAALPLFSAAPLGAPAAPWHFAGLPVGTKPATEFEVVELEGMHVLHVRANKSYGNLLYPLKGSVHALHWQWRLEEPLLRANLRTRDGDDSPIKLCILFDMSTDKLGLGERTQLATARALAHESLPSATLCYVWDHSLPVGTLLPNAFTRRLRYVVVDSGEVLLHQWVSHNRDIAADFAMAFGAESETLPPAMAVGVGADADNTGDSASAYVGDIVVTP